MRWTDLKDFTAEELSNFTWDDLSMDISDLLDMLKDENRPVPIDTYEKLVALAERSSITVDLKTPESSFDIRKYTFEVLLAILLHYLPSAEELRLALMQLPDNFENIIEFLNSYLLNLVS